MTFKRPEKRRVAYLKGTIVFAIATVLGLTAIGFVEHGTRDRILQNQRQVVLNRLHQVLPESAHDNDLLSDILMVTDPDFLGSDEPIQVHLARMNGKITGFIFHTIAPDGYQGRIHLLVGVYADGRLSDVHVAQHQETPGLGDNIHQDQSDWIQSFSGLSLNNTTESNWAVRRDGGQFDQFTGATVSPQAVVEAVHNTLLYFKANKDKLTTPLSVAK